MCGYKRIGETKGENKMKKKVIVLIALVAVIGIAIGAMLLLRPNEPAVDDVTPPVIDGVKDILCAAGDTVNLLDGVVATDDIDGDITDKIVIETMPTLVVTDGTVTPEKPGSLVIMHSSYRCFRFSSNRAHSRKIMHSYKSMSSFLHRFKIKYRRIKI